MASKSACYNEISRYERVRQNINVIIDYLNKAGANGEDVASTLNSSYLIDGTATPSKIRVNNLKNETIKTSNYLKNTIIPAINSAIASLRRQIAQIEAEEAAEEALKKAKVNK